MMFPFFVGRGQSPPLQIHICFGTPHRKKQDKKRSSKHKKRFSHFLLFLSISVRLAKNPFQFPLFCWLLLFCPLPSWGWGQKKNPAEGAGSLFSSLSVSLVLFLDAVKEAIFQTITCVLYVMDCDPDVFFIIPLFDGLDELLDGFVRLVGVRNPVFIMKRNNLPRVVAWVCRICSCGPCSINCGTDNIETPRLAAHEFSVLDKLADCGCGVCVHGLALCPFGRGEFPVSHAKHICFDVSSRKEKPKKTSHLPFWNHGRISASRKEKPRTRRGLWFGFCEPPMRRRSQTRWVLVWEKQKENPHRRRKNRWGRRERTEGNCSRTHTTWGRCLCFATIFIAFFCGVSKKGSHPRSWRRTLRKTD